MPISVFAARRAAFGRVCGGFLVLVVMLCGTVSAADETSDVVVDVVDAASGAPVSLARVILQGESATIGYTDADGHARFETVATGAYRASVSKRGYVAARSPLFDVVARRTTDVRVRLASAAGPKEIGRVTVSTSPARASREVGQDDSLRFLDGSLRDALGDLPGLTSSGGGLSIDGNDPSQTGASIDGVPLPGAGGGLAGLGINGDLFAGAGASSGAQNGALGGSVNFRTLQPTRLPQQQATLQYGSDNRSSAMFAARGSVRNLGYVFEHAVRGRTNPLTGETFTDESGLTYLHDGDDSTSGDLVKLRWAPALSQTLTATTSATNTQSGLVCTSQTALFPCGYGPGVFAHQRGGFATVSENATIGATTVWLSGFASSSRYDDDRRAAAFAGLPAPSVDNGALLSRGLNLSVQLPAGGKHELSLLATTYGLHFSGTSANSLGAFSFSQSSAYRAAGLTDRIRPNDKLTFTARAGVNGGSGNASFVTGLGVRWQPTRDVAYDLSGSAGDAGAGVALSGSAFPDPRSLTFDCAHGEAIGSLPSVNASRQRSSSLRASAERSGKRARVALTAWEQHQQGTPVLTAFDGAALGLPAAYLQAVGALASSPYVCGANAAPSTVFTSFTPADQTTRGATVAGTLQVGKALFAGYALVQSRFVTSYAFGSSSLAPPGAQVPDVPLHRLGVVASAKLGRAVDALANVSYTAANNPNRLPAYTVLNAGIAAPLRVGTIALVAGNLTNRYPGPFVSATAERTLPRAGFAPLALSATPLGPRAVSLTYTVRAGRVGATGTGAGAVDAASAASGNGEVSISLSFRPLPAVPGPGALRIDPDNENCTPVAARVAQPVLDALGVIHDTAERAKTASGYPTTLRGAPSKVANVDLHYIPYDNNAHYVVAVGGSLLYSAAVLNCAAIVFATPQEVVTRHLYAPPTAEKSGLFIAFSPLVGVYFAPPPQPPKGAMTSKATTDPEPAQPPADPFARRTDCPAQSKPVADALIVAVTAARAAQAAGRAMPTSDFFEVAAQGAAPSTWLELNARDAFAVTAAMQCLHVAAISREHLQASGITDDRRGSPLGFTDRFGFYLIQRPMPPASPASPAPSPSPSPSAAPH